MLIHRQMQRKLESLAQRVSVFAVLSICSSRKTESTAFREMICADTVEEREAALDKILPYAAGRLRRVCTRLWRDNPVTIRFLDPPLHEFVPTEEDDIKKLAEAQGKTG